VNLWLHLLWLDGLQLATQLGFVPGDAACNHEDNGNEGEELT
jgi:hypothetical protein|tara:strand:- start:261 stop:386 length:126 start_codon:yes stop_codon:yes gene_type:complete